MSKQIYTMNDAVKQRHASNAAFNAKCDKIQAEFDRIKSILSANPQIGILMRNGKTVYYVNFPEYREGSLEHLAAH